MAVCMSWPVPFVDKCHCVSGQIMWQVPYFDTFVAGSIVGELQFCGTFHFGASQVFWKVSFCQKCPLVASAMWGKLYVLSSSMWLQVQVWGKSHCAVSSIMRQVAFWRRSPHCVVNRMLWQVTLCMKCHCAPWSFCTQFHIKMWDVSFACKVHEWASRRLRQAPRCGKVHIV